MKKVYTKIKKLETNKQNTLRGDTAYRCYEQMFEGKAFWQQPFDPQKDMDIRLPYDLGTGRKFYGYNLTQLLSYKKPEVLKNLKHMVVQLMMMYLLKKK